MKFFNTLTQKKEDFTPINVQKVKMYCCGITPYSNIHLGHMRTFFSYDLLYRVLTDAGYKVDWARNITDVDDKIIAKAQAENKSCSDITNRYIEEQASYLKTFNLKSPQFEPRVTENIPQIIEMIASLIKKDFAYQSKSGVYFRVRKFPAYGKLSKNKIDDLKQGARIEIDETKEDPLDFALWKLAKPNEIFWESPWGQGRPGWHIECSAMIQTLFGESIDIHMGGRDLIFPHHEAEIAQSEACTGCALAHYWLHCGMMTLYHEKMSKSTNHVVTVKDFLSQYPAEVLRLVFLSVSYSQPLDFTFELAAENLKKLSRLYRFVSLMDNYTNEINSGAVSNMSQPFQEEIFVDLPVIKETIRSHLRNDLNSGSALATLFEFTKNINNGILQLEKQGHALSAQDKQTLLTHWESLKQWIASTLGILTLSPRQFFEDLRKFNCAQEISENEILEKLRIRQQYRDQKEWKQSDAIRDELLQYGVHIMDTPRGTKWFLQ